MILAEQLDDHISIILPKRAHIVELTDLDGRALVYYKDDYLEVNFSGSRYISDSRTDGILITLSGLPQRTILWT